MFKLISDATCKQRHSLGSSVFQTRHTGWLFCQLAKLFKLNLNLHPCSTLLLRRSTKWFDHSQQSIFQQFPCDEKNHLHSFSWFSVLHQRLWYTTHFHACCDRMRPHAQRQSRRAESHFNFPLICLLKSVMFAQSTVICTEHAVLKLQSHYTNMRSLEAAIMKLVSDHHSSHVSRSLTSPNKKDSSLLYFLEACPCFRLNHIHVLVSVVIYFSLKHLQNIWKRNPLCSLFAASKMSEPVHWNSVEFAWLTWHPKHKGRGTINNLLHKKLATNTF